MPLSSLLSEEQRSRGPGTGTKSSTLLPLLGPGPGDGPVQPCLPPTRLSPYIPLYSVYCYGPTYRS